MTIGTILPDCTVGISNWLSKNQPFMTISLSLLGWCFIIIGWLYNNRQSNLREDRKELRASIDNVIDEIHNIQLKAVEYYTTPAKTSAKLAFEIKSSQARLIVKFERLSKLHNGFFKIERRKNECRHSQ